MNNEEKYYTEIKNRLIDNEIYKGVKNYSINKHDLQTYYNVGKLLIEAQGGEKRAKYGNGLIKEYSKRLIVEIDKKYNERYLRDMRLFYITFNNEKWPPVDAKLSWSHVRIILSIKDINKINYYIAICEQQNLSVRQLKERIKSKEYERLPEESKQKLINKEE